MRRIPVQSSAIGFERAKTRNGGTQGGGGGAAVHDNIGTKGGGDPDVFCSGLAGIGCGDIREEEDATA